MLRLVLLVLYLATSFFSSSDRGSGWDPYGLNTPPASETDGGSGWDPAGLDTPPPSETDGGGGADPLG